MTTRRSAGLLLFRRSSNHIEVLLAHMGGPFWANKDVGAWTIPKGEHGLDEEPLVAAHREFVEELGVPAPGGAEIPLGEVRQSGGKLVTAWAVEGDFDPADLVPGTFELEWPRGSGRFRSFPEVDRVAWFDLEAAHEHIVTGQRALLDRLRDHLDTSSEQRSGTPM